MKYHDYYETLGVARTATQDDISKAYRKLARKFHPDISKEKDAEARFKQIVEAYEVLKDTDKRKRYDHLGADWKAGQDFQPPPGFEGVRFDFGGDGGPDDLGGFSDFFQTFFGGSGAGAFRGGRTAGGRGGGGAGADFASNFRRRARARAEAPPEKGSSHEVDLDVTLEEAYRGGTKRIDLAVQETLPTGEQRRSKRSYEVRIPAGVTDGKKIRLAGQGGASSTGGEAGDLILKVRLAPHPRYKVEGHDLVLTLPLAPWEAALGAKLAIDTLDGALTVTVPPGSQSGQRLRLRERGLPIGPGGGTGSGGPSGASGGGASGGPSASAGRGHLLVELKIVVPRELTAEERRLFEELSRASTFAPRAGA